MFLNLSGRERNFDCYSYALESTTLKSISVTPRRNGKEGPSLNVAGGRDSDRQRPAQTSRVSLRVRTTRG